MGGSLVLNGCRRWFCLRVYVNIFGLMRLVLKCDEDKTSRFAYAVI